MPRRFSRPTFFDEFDSYFVEESPRSYWGHHPSQYFVRPAYRPTSSTRSEPVRRLTHRFATPSVLDFFDIDHHFDNHFNRMWNDFETFEQEPAQTIAAPAHTKSISAATDSASSSAPSTAAASKAVVSPPKSQALSFANTKENFGAVSRKETDNGTEIAVALPGLTLEDVKLDFDLKSRYLTLSAEHKTESKNEKTGSSFYRQYSIKRVLPIPSTEGEPIKPEDISADLEDGVLTIAINHKPAGSPVAAAAVAGIALASSTQDEEAKEETSTSTTEIADSSAAETEQTTSSTMDVDESTSASSSVSTSKDIESSSSSNADNEVSVEDADD